MLRVNTKKIEDLLRVHKLSEAKQEIEAFFAQKLSSDEEAEVHIDMALLYMKVVNGINEQYKSALEEILDEVKQIDSEKKKTNERLSIAEVRASLQS